MADHAKLSPSAAERWFTCPGSMVLSAGIPNRSSAHAEEGTFAHGVAEQILKGGQPTCEPEMLRHVKVYTDYVDELFRDGDVRAIEKRVEVLPGVWGTADAIVWQEKTRTLHIVDLKYGTGVAVEVSNNLQLKIYALAALKTMKLNAKLVVATIVQPRLPHPDGLIRSKEFDVVDLIEFHADLVEAVEEVEDCAKVRSTFSEDAWAGMFLRPSEKACRWCLAAPTCPKLKDKAQQMAKLVFAPTANQVCDYAKLSEALDFAPIIEGWAKNVREFAYAEAERGAVIPGYKLVEKRATRKWKEDVSPDALAEATGIDADELVETKLISPASVEKLLPKAERAVLETLTSKESSGHTLVHESDKRDPIRVDAKAAFAAFV